MWDNLPQVITFYKHKGRSDDCYGDDNNSKTILNLIELSILNMVLFVKMFFNLFSLFFKCYILDNFLLFSGTEEDFKFWSSDFLSHFKETSDKTKETSCHCSSESKSTGKTCCHSEENLNGNNIQDDEVLSYIQAQAIQWLYKNQSLRHNISLELELKSISSFYKRLIAVRKMRCSYRQ